MLYKQNLELLAHRIAYIQFEEKNTNNVKETECYQENWPKAFVVCPYF